VNGVVWCFTEIFVCKMPFSETAVICKSSLIPKSALLMSRGHKAGLEGDRKGKDYFTGQFLLKSLPHNTS